MAFVAWGSAPFGQVDSAAGLQASDLRLVLILCRCQRAIAATAAYRGQLTR